MRTRTRTHTHAPRLQVSNAFLVETNFTDGPTLRSFQLFFERILDILVPLQEAYREVRGALGTARTLLWRLPLDARIRSFPHDFRLFPF